MVLDVHFSFFFFSVNLYLFQSQQGLIGEVWHTRHIPSGAQHVLKLVRYEHGAARELRTLNTLKGAAHCVQVIFAFPFCSYCSLGVLFSLLSSPEFPPTFLLFCAVYDSPDLLCLLSCALGVGSHLLYRRVH